MGTPASAHSSPKISILGTRGIPAAHGGFETFAERLVLFLVRRGWGVTMYCQLGGSGPIREDQWRGIRRLNIPVSRDGALGTVVFDWKSTVNAAAEDCLKLTLGYNTAAFAALYRLRGRVNLFNMDGMEWKREKWGLRERSWLWLNEGLGCLLANHLIADHPEIKRHLECRTDGERITVIPYGSDTIDRADASVLGRFGLEPNGYSLVIAQPEPENSILEIVRAFSANERAHKLVVLGRYEPELSDFHRAVLEAAGPEVAFLGAIYDAGVVSAFALFLSPLCPRAPGGRNQPIAGGGAGGRSRGLAHNNRFNRWVAGEEAAYFDGETDCNAQFNRPLHDRKRLRRMAQSSRRRHAEAFTWDLVLAAYEDLLGAWCGGASGGGPRIAVRLPWPPPPVTPLSSPRSRVFRP